jgi:hypothetical protein
MPRYTPIAGDGDESRTLFKNAIVGDGLIEGHPTDVENIQRQANYDRAEARRTVKTGIGGVTTTADLENPALPRCASCGKPAEITEGRSHNAPTRGLCSSCAADQALTGTVVTEKCTYCGGHGYRVVGARRAKQLAAEQAEASDERGGSAV